MEVSKRGSKKGKEVQFPLPKCGPSDQTTPPCQGGHVEDVDNEGVGDLGISSGEVAVVKAGGVVEVCVRQCLVIQDLFKGNSDFGALC